MIASPSDVTAERNIVRLVLSEWNVIHSFSRRIVLLPVGWETHSTPEMGARPQELINKQILKDCDLLVGVFWTRIGTATGGFASGSVEEIEEHLAAGKPAMLYFSDVPVALKSVDQEQYRLLTEFRESVYKRGLVETFVDPAEFQDKFRRHLQLKLNEEAYFVERSTQQGGLVDELPTTVPQRAIPALSAEARQLLVEAASSDDGHIMFVRYIGGVNLQANGKNFLEGANARARAIWQGALEELINEGLIRDLGHKGEIFEITREGYDLAEILRK